MSEVKPLPRPGADEQVVRVLEGILERAKTGELRAFYCAMVLDGDRLGSATGGATAGSGYTYTPQLIMAMERAKLRMLGFVEDVDIGISLGR